MKEKLMLFVFNPFLSFIYSLQDVKSRSSYLVFFLICILFGWMFIAGNESGDSYVYRMEYLQFSNFPDLNLSRKASEYFDPDTLERDFYRYIIYWVASKIGGNNYHFLFMTVAVVFSYFYLRCMSYVTNNEKFEQNLYGLLLLFLFIYGNSIFNINGFRFYTATWMAVLVIFEIVVEHNFRYLFLMAILPLVHVSMPLFWVLFLFSWILRNKFNIVFPLLFLSFFVSTLSFALLEWIQPYLPNVLQSLVWTYSQSSTSLSRLEVSGAPLYAVVLTKLPDLFFMAMTFLLFIERKNFVSKKGKEILGFYVAFYSFVNFISAVPSAGRFFFVSIPVLIYVWTDNYDVMKKYNRYFILIPVVFSYYLLWLFRQLADQLSPEFFFAPLPIQIYCNL